jgi:O-antigen/teichoic acid export membrane protein
MTSSGSVNSAARRLSIGVAWNTAFTFSKDALQFGLTMILTRLLTPEIYGQFSLISSIVTFATAVSFRNFLAHSLQFRADEKVDYEQHAAFAVILQSIIFLIINAIAIGLWFSHFRSLAVPLATMSPLVFVDIPSEIGSRMLERELNWSTLRLLNLLGFVCGGVVSIALAVRGVGVYALLVPNLIYPIPVVVYFFRGRKVRFRWRLALEQYRPSLNFGIARLLSGLFGQGRGLLESTTIAALLSLAALGIYGRATALSQLFIYRFIFLLMTSAYPVLTTVLAGSSAAHKARILLLRAICWGSAGAGLTLSFGADAVIRLVYGAQWLAAIPLVSAAVASRIASGHRYAVASLLLADNESRKCVWLDAISLLTFSATLPALRVSVPTFLYCDAAGQLTVSIIGLWWLSRASLDSFRAAIRPVVEAAIAATLVYLPMRVALPFAHAIGARLAVSALATLAFLLILRMMFSAATFELIRVLPFSRVTRRIFAFTGPEYSGT